MKFKINAIQKRAEELKNLITKSEEIFKDEITAIFWGEIEEQVKIGEIIIMEIHAKPRLGKSTSGIYIAMIIDKLLKKYGKKSKGVQFGMRNIARDDQEYSKLMRNPELMNDVIVTDEQNALEEGGENSSTENQLKRVFSDVQAGRYVHRICISPNKEIDENADMKLEIVGVDRGTMTTHCRLYYRITGGEGRYWQPVGFVNICVKNLIDNWEKRVKAIFYKKVKTKEEMEFLEKECKRDFYVEYMTKKYEKMELITKEGILRPRELDYAGVVLSVLKETRGLCKIMRVSDKLVKNYIEIEFKRQRLAGSIIGIRLATDRVMGLLSLYENLYKMCREQAKTDTMFNSGKITANEKEMRNEQIGEVITKIKNAIENQEGELEKYKSKNEEYNKHISE